MIGTDIAELTTYLIEQNDIKEYRNIKLMVEESIKMVSNSIIALMNKDLELANKVIEDDDIVDNLFAQIKEELVIFIKSDTVNGKQALDLIMIAKYLEKIADHSVNIARWVIFTITGKN